MLIDLFDVKLAFNSKLFNGLRYLFAEGEWWNSHGELFLGIHKMWPSRGGEREHHGRD
jgi:hypothetical protein